MLSSSPLNSWSHSGIAGCRGNSAVVVLVFGHFYVAIIAPFWTPTERRAYFLFYTKNQVHIKFINNN